jgi:4-diphosphocytidyl-2-C-methyl-D-erythritol kinase
MPETSFSLPSFAKINLGLRVIGRREDGFHDIFTVFQTVSLHDTLTFSPAAGLELTCDDPSIPTDGRNLILRAAEKLRDRASRAGAFDTASSPGASIHLEKRIPSPGGLGGGSSNAAVALVGLKRLWGVDLPEASLSEIACELGSDVPFFLSGGTAAGAGRGTDLESLADFEAAHILIVSPDIAVSTAEAFNALSARSLTSPDANRILGVCRSEARSADLHLSAMRNDFESTVFAAHPEIGSVKQKLLELGAAQASLSGSGASVFGIFDKKETRQAAQKALDNEVNWRKFAVATISRNEYREALGITF